MNKQQYAMTQVQLIQVAAELRGLDLDGFVDWIGRADSIGSVLDPTLYLKNLRAGDPMSKLRTIAIAAKAMRDAMPESCRECGCTNERACQGGCSWMAPGLCSSCLPGLVDVAP